MDEVIGRVREELKRSTDEKTKGSGDRFFKEEVKLYGVSVPRVNAIAKDGFASIAGRKKKEIFALCGELWQSGFMEESFIACNWAYALRESYEPADFTVFEGWVKNHVSNWASCDTLCNHTIGTFIEMYPEYIVELKEWAGSGNRWVRRASAVTLIIPAREGKFLTDVFEIADMLLLDRDDLVQKGYGWLLKAAAARHEGEVFRYVMNKKSVMPRTALRYAIEKMPHQLKKQAMER
jgi:3-methyladenine DNA glycosylase AlkD